MQHASLLFLWERERMMVETIMKLSKFEKASREVSKNAAIC